MASIGQQLARPALALPPPARRQGCPPPALLLPQQQHSSAPTAFRRAAARRRQTVPALSAARGSAGPNGGGGDGGGSGGREQPPAQASSARNGEQWLALKAAEVQQDLAKIVNMQRRALQPRGCGAALPQQPQRAPHAGQQRRSSATGASAADDQGQGTRQQRWLQHRNEGGRDSPPGRQHAHAVRTSRDGHSRALQSVSVHSDVMDAAIAHTFPVTGNAAPSDDSPGSRRQPHAPGSVGSSQRGGGSGSKGSKGGGSSSGSSSDGASTLEAPSRSQQRGQGGQRARQQVQEPGEAASTWPPSISKTKNVLVVSAALINAKNEVLLSKRVLGNVNFRGQYEFPGGKVEPGEIPQYALQRELHEELGVEVKENALQALTFVSHRYRYYHHNFLALLFVAEEWRNEPRSMEGQGLVWVRCEELLSYADRVPEPTKRMLAAVYGVMLHRQRQQAEAEAVTAADRGAAADRRHRRRRERQRARRRAADGDTDGRESSEPKQTAGSSTPRDSAPSPARRPSASDAEQKKAPKDGGGKQQRRQARSSPSQSSGCPADHRAEPSGEAASIDGGADGMGIPAAKSRGKQAAAGTRSSNRLRTATAVHSRRHGEEQTGQQRRQRGLARRQRLPEGAGAAAE